MLTFSVSLSLSAHAQEIRQWKGADHLQDPAARIPENYGGDWGIAGETRSAGASAGGIAALRVSPAVSPAVSTAVFGNSGAGAL